MFHSTLDGTKRFKGEVGKGRGQGDDDALRSFPNAIPDHARANLIRF